MQPAAAGTAADRRLMTADELRPGDSLAGALVAEVMQIEGTSGFIVWAHHPDDGWRSCVLQPGQQLADARRGDTRADDCESWYNPRSGCVEPLTHGQWTVASDGRLRPAQKTAL